MTTDEMNMRDKLEEYMELMADIRVGSIHSFGEALTIEQLKEVRAASQNMTSLCSDLIAIALTHSN